MRPDLSQPARIRYLGAAPKSSKSLSQTGTRLERPLTPVSSIPFTFALQTFMSTYWHRSREYSGKLYFFPLRRFTGS
jgi:hypothetical protein